MFKLTKSFGDDKKGICECPYTISCTTLDFTLVLHQCIISSNLQGEKWGGGRERKVCMIIAGKDSKNTSITKIRHWLVKLSVFKQAITSKAPAPGTREPSSNAFLIALRPSLMASLVWVRVCLYGPRISIVTLWGFFRSSTKVYFVSPWKYNKISNHHHH